MHRRRPEPVEKSAKKRDAAAAREKRLARYDKPPTWRSAITKAFLAAIAFAVLSALLTKRASRVGRALPRRPHRLHGHQLLHRHVLYRRRLRQKAAGKVPR